MSITETNVHRSTKAVSNRLSATLCLLVFITASASLLPFSANADDTNTESVLLSIRGNMEGADNTVIELDLTSLTSMESTTVTTKTPWTNGPTQYTGVRINTLLNHAGAKTNQFEAIALNDYRFTLSDIDFDKYPIIIAYQKNGELLDVRNLGPLMIVFPFDNYPELLTERNKAASVWQLLEMIIL